MENYVTFETERLLVQPTNEADAAFILELMNTPKWIKYIGQRNVHTEADALAYIQNRMLPQLRGYGHTYIARNKDVWSLCSGKASLYPQRRPVSPTSRIYPDSRPKRLVDHQIFESFSPERNDIAFVRSAEK